MNYLGGIASRVLTSNLPWRSVGSVALSLAAAVLVSMSGLAYSPADSDVAGNAGIQPPSVESVEPQGDSAA